jgi:hypothetical protein
MPPEPGGCFALRDIVLTPGWDTEASCDFVSPTCPQRQQFGQMSIPRKAIYVGISSGLSVVPRGGIEPPTP